MSQELGVTIVIPNFNYASFLAAAIDSALAQDHPEVQVIVVDDCSTDGSKDVIARYDGRVTGLLMPVNGGQIAAVRAALSRARHDIVMILDADDLLMPGAVSRILAAWTPDTAKVQFPMTTIDEAGRPLDHVAPKYPAGLTTAALRRELLESGGCFSTPGTGNAYSRQLVLDVLSPDSAGVRWLDTLLEVNAPFAGEVVTLYEPLACYRMHGNNNFQTQELSAERFAKFLSAHDQKLAYMARRSQTWGVTFDPASAKRRSSWYVACSMAAAKLGRPAGSLGGSPAAILSGATRAFLRSPGQQRRKALLLVWLAAVALLPKKLAEQVIAYRFVVASRPRWFERVLQTISR